MAFPVRLLILVMCAGVLGGCKAKADGNDEAAVTGPAIPSQSAAAKRPRVRSVSRVATTASTGETKNCRFSNIFLGSVTPLRLARKNDTVASSKEVRNAKIAPVASAGRIAG